MRSLPDLRVRARKAAGDLWVVRGRGALAALLVGVGALCPRLQALEGAVTVGVALLTLLGVGLALAPLGRARAAELPLLRLLGATDAEALYFAVLEAGGLGALAGLAGTLLAFALSRLFGMAGLPIVGAASPGTLLVWLMAAGLAGALAGALAFHAARSADASGSFDRA